MRVINFSRWYYWEPDDTNLVVGKDSAEDTRFSNTMRGSLDYQQIEVRKGENGYGEDVQLM